MANVFFFANTSLNFLPPCRQNFICHAFLLLSALLSSISAPATSSFCSFLLPLASVHSGFAASYLPPVKAVPKLLKSLLPGGKEDRDQTAVHQQVHSFSQRTFSGFKLLFCLLSYQGFKSLYASLQPECKYPLYSSEAISVSPVAMETEFM